MAVRGLALLGASASGTGLIRGSSFDQEHGTATPSVLERVARLRDYAVELTTHPRVPMTGEIPQAGAEMGRLYAYKDKLPQVAPSALLLDSAELTGDVIVEDDVVIGPGAMIHGCVRL